MMHIRCRFHGAILPESPPPIPVHKDAHENALHASPYLVIKRGVKDVVVALHIPRHARRTRRGCLVRSGA